MPLTGELSDLSLAELIEFFCNQRKTGRLEVTYPVGAGYFYLKSGTVVHARFGDLKGIDAVFYALTQPNASFTFNHAFEAPEQTINQPWTSVVLEGLRRMDEGVVPLEPSPNTLEQKSGSRTKNVEPVSTSAPLVVSNSTKAPKNSVEDVQAFGVLLSSSDTASFARRRWHPAIVVAAIVALIAGVGVPWALYSQKKAARAATETSVATSPTPTSEALTDEATPEPLATDPEIPAEADATDNAKRQREAKARERARALEQGASNTGNNVDGVAKPVVANSGSANVQPPATSNKRATVQVTYDENGRVTAASGGDATALRIARQKRFPPGKAGSATITIPIN